MAKEPVGIRTGQLAQRAGVNIQTVRYYERRGLLRPMGRSATGYRAFAPDAVAIVRFIKRAQQLGFTLVEVADLVRLRNGGGRQRALVRSLAQAKVNDIDGRIRELAAMRDALCELVHACECEGPSRCAIIETLSGDPSSSGGTGR